VPVYLIPPPSNFLFSLALKINDLLPQTIEPTGAQRPLLKQNVTESQTVPIKEGSISSLVKALNSLAPSMCTFKPFSFAKE
jgi:hypothetical protein